MNNSAFLRLPQIVGSRKRGIAPLIPVSASTWWSWVREGRAPEPVKLSPRVTVWRASDIEELIRRLGKR